MSSLSPVPQYLTRDRTLILADMKINKEKNWLCTLKASKPCILFEIIIPCQSYATEIICDADTDIFTAAPFKVTKIKRRKLIPIMKKGGGWVE